VKSLVFILRGLIYLIAYNLKIYDSTLVRKWLEEHPRIERAFIPKAAAWLNFIEEWWRNIPATGLRRTVLCG
jgi:DDE superfamily endonuclease